MSHARIDHQHAQFRNAHTSVVLEAKLNREQGVSLALETDEPAQLRGEWLAHRIIARFYPAPQPLGGERARISHDDAVHLRRAGDLGAERPCLAESTGG